MRRMRKSGKQRRGTDNNKHRERKARYEGVKKQRKMHFITVLLAPDVRPVSSVICITCIIFLGHLVLCIVVFISHMGVFAYVGYGFVLCRFSLVLHVLISSLPSSVFSRPPSRVASSPGLEKSPLQSCFCDVFWVSWQVSLRYSVRRDSKKTVIFTWTTYLNSFVFPFISFFLSFSFVFHFFFFSVVLALGSTLVFTCA